jgi:hypothetical protein
VTVASRARPTATGSTFTSGTPQQAVAAQFPPAAEGTLLHVTWAVDKTPGAYNPPPEGWQVLTAQVGASTSVYALWKVAAGGETTVTASWTGTASDGASWVADEWTDFDPDDPWGALHAPPYSDTARTSITFDPPATDARSGRALAFITKDTANYPAGFVPAADGWVHVVTSGRADAAGAPAVAVMERVNGFTPGEDLGPTTFTDPVNDQTSGYLVVLNDAPPVLTLAAIGNVGVNASAASAGTAPDTANPTLTRVQSLTQGDGDYTLTLTQSTEAYQPLLVADAADSFLRLDGANDRVANPTSTGLYRERRSLTQAVKFRMQPGTNTGERRLVSDTADRANIRTVDRKLRVGGDRGRTGDVEEYVDDTVDLGDGRWHTCVVRHDYVANRLVAKRDGVTFYDGPWQAAAPDVGQPSVASNGTVTLGSGSSAYAPAVDLHRWVVFRGEDVTDADLLEVHRTLMASRVPPPPPPEPEPGPEPSAPVLDITVVTDAKPWEQVTHTVAVDDPDGGPFTYAWSVESTDPPGVLGTGDLTGADTATVRYEMPPTLGGAAVTLRCVVTDPSALTGTATVTDTGLRAPAAFGVGLRPVRLLSSRSIDTMLSRFPLAPPVGLTLSEPEPGAVRAVWDPVPGATAYEVRQEGVPVAIATVTATVWQSAPTYLLGATPGVSVVATAPGRKPSDPSMVEYLTIGGVQTNPETTLPAPPAPTLEEFGTRRVRSRIPDPVDNAGTPLTDYAVDWWEAGSPGGPVGTTVNSPVRETGSLTRTNPDGSPRTYRYSAVVRDVSGQRVSPRGPEAAIQLVGTTAAPAPPVVTSAGVTAGTNTLAWTLTTAPDSTVDASLRLVEGGPVLQAVNLPAGATHTVTFDSLADSTRYYLDARAVTAAGGVNTFTDTAVTATAPVGPVTASLVNYLGMTRDLYYPDGTGEFADCPTPDQLPDVYWVPSDGPAADFRAPHGELVIRGGRCRGDAANVIDYTEGTRCARIICPFGFGDLNFSGTWCELDLWRVAIVQGWQMENTQWWGQQLPLYRSAGDGRLRRNPVTPVRYGHWFYEYPEGVSGDAATIDFYSGPDPWDPTKTRSGRMHERSLYVRPGSGFVDKPVFYALEAPYWKGPWIPEGLNSNGINGTGELVVVGARNEQGSVYFRSESLDKTKSWDNKWPGGDNIIQQYTNLKRLRLVGCTGYPRYQGVFKQHTVSESIHVIDVNTRRPAPVGDPDYGNGWSGYEVWPGSRAEVPDWLIRNWVASGSVYYRDQYPEIQVVPAVEQVDFITAGAGIGVAYAADPLAF